jgi:hypothetical protein
MKFRRMCSTVPKRFAIVAVARRITLAGVDLRGSSDWRLRLRLANATEEIQKPIEKVSREVTIKWFP